MAQLPHFILDEVLEYIPRSERLELALVNRQWKHRVRLGTPSCLTYIDVPMDTQGQYPALLTRVGLMPFSKAQWRTTSDLRKKFVELEMWSIDVPKEAEAASRFAEARQAARFLTLRCSIDERWMADPWLLAFRFDKLKLCLRDVDLEIQYGVLGCLHQNVVILSLHLAAPDDGILEAIQANLPSLRQLSLKYFKPGAIASLNSVEHIKARFAKGALVPCPKTYLLESASSLYLYCADFPPNFENEPVVFPTVHTLHLAFSEIRKPVLDAHFQALVAFTYRLYDLWIEDWAIAVDLANLRTLSLLLPLCYDYDYDFPTGEPQYKTVTNLSISGIAQVKTSLWSWISRGFPSVTLLNLDKANLPKDPAFAYAEDVEMPSLLVLKSAIDLPLDFYTSFDKFAPNVRGISIPKAIYRQYLASHRNTPHPFDIFPL